MEIPAMIEQDSDYALLTEIAVAYYDQEQTQEEIAKTIRHFAYQSRAPAEKAP
ncbi:hypothetical protein [Klebsiella pneumoniae]|uniref:hypothetical protein n=1 Tax=Klebsiella pneumoniae TaxID=573 RepID=UPI001E42298C|nr:hypothetical protein [Klebsiella pneumoniae]